MVSIRALIAGEHPAFRFGLCAMPDTDKAQTYKRIEANTLHISS